MPGSVSKAAATVESVKGTIKSSFEQSEGRFELNVTVPSNTDAIVGIPAKYTFRVTLNNKTIWRNGEMIKNKMVKKYTESEDGTLLFEVSPGVYEFISLSK
jgi:hypothetical protein